MLCLVTDPHSLQMTMHVGVLFWKMGKAINNLSTEALVSKLRVFYGSSPPHTCSLVGHSSRTSWVRCLALYPQCCSSRGTSSLNSSHWLASLPSPAVNLDAGPQSNIVALLRSVAWPGSADSLALPSLLSAVAQSGIIKLTTERSFIINRSRLLLRTCLEMLRPNFQQQLASSLMVPFEPL